MSAFSSRRAVACLSRCKRMSPDLDQKCPWQVRRGIREATLGIAVSGSGGMVVSRFHDAVLRVSRHEFPMPQTVELRYGDGKRNEPGTNLVVCGGGCGWKGWYPNQFGAHRKVGKGKGEKKRGGGR